LAARSSIESFIAKSVGILIELPANVCQCHIFILLSNMLGFAKEVLEFRIFHLVFAVHLLHEQFAIAKHGEFSNAKFMGEFESPNQSGILGDVVRSFADRVAVFDVGLSIAAENHGIRRGAGVAARAAVDVYRGLGHAEVLNR